MQRWNSDEGGRGREHCPGGLWLSEAPQKVIDDGKTYCVLQVLDGGFDNTFTSRVEMPVLQFGIFATSEKSKEQDNPAWTARDDIVSVFDDALLTMEDDANNKGRRMIQMRRQGFGNLVKDPEEGWNCFIQYQCQFTFDK